MSIENKVDSKTINAISKNFYKKMTELLGSVYTKRNKYEDAAVVTINRELLAKLLELNTDNRAIKSANLKLLKNEMNKGTYRDTGASIVVYWDLCLGDGQHRLLGFSESDLDKLKITIRWGGWRSENFPVTDQGVKRATHEALNENPLHMTICKFINKFLLSSVNSHSGNSAWKELCDKCRSAFEVMHQVEVSNLNKWMFRNPMCAAFYLYYTAADKEGKKEVLAMWKKMLIKNLPDGSPGSMGFRGVLATAHIAMDNNRNLSSDKERDNTFYLSCLFFDDQLKHDGYKITDSHKKRIKDMAKTLFN
jgi:hypothetical protein